jgi:hypothetical protein
LNALNVPVKLSVGLSVFDERAEEIEHINAQLYEKGRKVTGVNWAEERNAVSQG